MSQIDFSFFCITSSAHSNPSVSNRFDPPLLPLAMSATPSPPCGLAPTPGIPLVAQAVLHRELLCVHASLAHIDTILHQPLALRSTPLLDRVTHPHLRAQLEGLDNTHYLHFGSITPPFTTPTNFSPHWASCIFHIIVQINLKLNFRAARTSATAHFFLLPLRSLLFTASPSPQVDLRLSLILNFLLHRLLR